MDQRGKATVSQAQEMVQENALREDIIAGRNAVREVLRSGQAIDSILVARGERSGSLKALLAQCREKDVLVKEVDPRKLDTLCGPHHQGIAAVTSCKETVSLDELFRIAQEKGEPPFFVICDQLEDPHNLGAILRTAEAVGAHGVVIPKRRSAGLTSTVYKASVGAAAYIAVARVSNLVAAIQEMKKRGVWIYGLDMDGETWCTADLRGAAAIVVGSEGQGIGRLVREQCDRILSLPMLGSINSLNASVACGILLYEVCRQRREIIAR